MEQEDQLLYNKYFCGKRNGTYVEMGALDGITFSNTKFYEDHMGWSGALIEPAPPSFEQLFHYRGSGRNSLFEEAVCAEGVGHLDFLVGDVAATNSAVGDMPDKWVKHWGGDPQTVRVPCRPLGAMLRDMLKRTGAGHIDFFSLDVEGGELQVLETMDWSLDVRMWLIEWNGGRPWKPDDLADVMMSHGYIFSPKGATMKNNAVFVRP